jgi:ABC-2 type transport system permease protein
VTNDSRSFLRNTLALAKALLAEAIDDKMSLGFTVLLPVTFLLIFGSMQHGGSAQRIPVVVVNRAGALGERFIVVLRDTNLVNIKPVQQRIAVGDESLKDTDTSVIELIVPAVSSASVPLVYVSAPSSVGPLLGVAVDAARARLLDMSGSGHKNLIGGSEFNFASGPRVQLFSFVFPGILALTMLQVGLFATTRLLVRARDTGELVHLSILPISRASITLAYICVRLLLCVVITMAILLIGEACYHVPVPWQRCFELIVLSSAMMVAVGFALAGVVTARAGNAILTLFNLAMVFGGQVFFDVSANPLARTIASAMPITPVSDALRQVIDGSRGLMLFTTDAALIALWLAASSIIATRTFQFEARHR